MWEVNDAQEQSKAFAHESSEGATADAVQRQGGARSCGERSEEHTSELQSRFDLVCRLLLVEPPQSILFPYTTLFRSNSSDMPARLAEASRMDSVWTASVRYVGGERCARAK